MGEPVQGFWPRRLAVMLFLGFGLLSLAAGSVLIALAGWLPLYTLPGVPAGTDQPYANWELPLLAAGVIAVVLGLGLVVLYWVFSPRCPSCGNENRWSATYCDSCATVLEPRPSG